MEYRTLDSFLIRRYSRSHSLSGVSPAMRQDFAPPYSSGSPPLFAANPGAASRFSAALHPPSRGGTSIRLCLPAGPAAVAPPLPSSARRSARSPKNNLRPTPPPLPSSPPHLPPPPSSPALPPL